LAELPNICLSLSREYGTNVSKDHDGECKEVVPVSETKGKTRGMPGF